MKILLSDRLIRRLIARICFAMGMSAAKVASFLDVNFHVVRDWKLLEQLANTKHPNPNLKRSRIQAIGLFKQGWGYKRTAHYLGVNLYTCRYWLRSWRKAEAYRE